MVKIGVTGTFCAGKDTFADYLVKIGFEHISLSDIIREEAKKDNLEITRENLRFLGNKLREEQGNAVLAERAIINMKDNNNYVITSIRNPLEVKKLYSSKNFILVNVDAPIEERFRRLVAREDIRKEDGDNLTFDKFVESEKKEMVSDNKNGQNILNCIDMARLTLLNDSDFDSFYKKIDQTLLKIEEILSFSRPSWDEYFLELSRVIGKRGTCDRGRAGCVIVKDKRVIATGYVGAPPRMAHCDEVGHWFKKTIHEDGTITQHCIRTVHSEANAVAQAAKYGINMDGATLYCKMEPCLDCTKLLISSGIKKIVCENKYHAATESREMLIESGILLEVVNNKLEEYPGQK